MTDEPNRDISRSESQEMLIERLRTTREYLGLSQEFVAQHTGISRPAISAIENGKRKVDSLELLALSKLYKHPVTYFLEGSADEPTSVRAIARAATALTDKDREQVLLFAQFLDSFGKQSLDQASIPEDAE